MKTLALILLVCLAALRPAAGMQEVPQHTCISIASTSTASSGGGGRGGAGAGAGFWAVDLYIDSDGAELASYQLELSTGAAEIVGIEAGDFPVYTATDAPLWYDPAALMGNRVVLADCSTRASVRSVAPIRIATVHLHGGDINHLALKLHVAGDAEGQAVEAAVSLNSRKKGN